VHGGTPFYLAPERTQGGGSAATSRSATLLTEGGASAFGPSHPSAVSPLSPASDVYSLGVCVAEMHGGFATAMERAAVVGALKKAAGETTDGKAAGGGARRTSQPMLSSLEAEELALSMLAPHPTARPMTADVERTAIELAG